MRTHYLFAACAASSLLAGACKWTDFDDLEAETWVRSTQDPGLGSTDYAVAIGGVSTGTSGGTLAVVSDDTANYSTIDYSAKGEANVNKSSAVKLGAQQIGAISEAPIFATDPTGRIGIVERSINGGNFAVYFGSATAPTGIEFASASTPAPTPDAALFVPGTNGNAFMFAAGNALYTLQPAGGTPAACTGTDNMGMPLQVAAMDHDGTNLWVWTQSGSLISYALDAIATCDGGNLPSPGAASFESGMMPAPGARVHIVAGHAILTGHPMTTRSGSVFVVRLSDGVQVGTTLTVEGLRTSTLASLAGTTYLAIGVPDRNVEGVAAGEVDLHAFNEATGMLDAEPALSLHDADPDSGQLYGRTVTTMTFNGNPILVVGAKNEIFAYYRTALYDHLP